MSSAYPDTILSAECVPDAQEEAELRRKRLECVGALSGGIMHDLNNVLTPILMGVQLLRREPSEESRRTVLDVIESSARRGADTVRQLLIFARGERSRTNRVAVGVVVAETVALLRQTLPKNITVTERVAADLPEVSFDASQLLHVLLNLGLNARDAMPGGGELRIDAAPTQDNAAAAGAGAPSVTLSVADTGKGMGPDVLARVFEPFFSTKPPGQGTGLGLATVRRLVEGHHGEIEIQSRPERGTTVLLRLRAARAGVAAERSARPPPPRGRGELILVVDDEGSIREIMSKILQDHGFETVAAAHGAAAAAAHQEYGGSIRLTVTDLDMPGVDGLRLVANLGLPPSRVLIITGQYELDSGTFAVPSGMKVLRKPFTPAELLEAVHGLLAGTPAGARQRGSN